MLGVKVLVVARDPIERFESWYGHVVGRHVVGDPPGIAACIEGCTFAAASTGGGRWNSTVQPTPLRPFLEGLVKHVPAKLRKVVVLSAMTVETAARLARWLGAGNATLPERSANKRDAPRLAGRDEDLCSPALRPALARLRVKLADDYDALIAALRLSGERVPKALLQRRSRCDSGAGS